MIISVHDVRRALIGMQFPATRDEVSAHVRRSGGQPQLLAAVRALPDRRYESADEVARTAANSTHHGTLYEG